MGSRSGRARSLAGVARCTHAAGRVTVSLVAARHVEARPVIMGYTQNDRPRHSGTDGDGHAPHHPPDSPTDSPGDRDQDTMPSLTYTELAEALGIRDQRSNLNPRFGEKLIWRLSRKGRALRAPGSQRGPRGTDTGVPPLRVSPEFRSGLITPVHCVQSEYLGALD
jgi:hypothetical protein